MDLKETQILGANIVNHWYYISKAKAVMRYLKGIKISSILDVGAGSAFFSKYLLANTYAKEAWCVDVSYANNSDAIESGKPLHYRKSIEYSNSDVILLMDVLEHVEDDIGLLTEYVGKVSSGTVFLITVPAFNFLWSKHDDYLGHKRRYRLKYLENIVSMSGLSVKGGSYYFAAVFPIASAIRLLEKIKKHKSEEASSQLTQHNPITNRILMIMSNVELAFMLRNRAFGLSVFCMAQKP